jgi:hypothetical protein
LAVVFEHAPVDQALLLLPDGFKHHLALGLLQFEFLLANLSHFPEELGLPVVVEDSEGFLVGCFLAVFVGGSEEGGGHAKNDYIYVM